MTVLLVGLPHHKSTHHPYILLIPCLLVLFLHRSIDQCIYPTAFPYQLLEEGEEDAVAPPAAEAKDGESKMDVSGN